MSYETAKARLEAYKAIRSAGRNPDPQPLTMTGFEDHCDHWHESVVEVFVHAPTDLEAALKVIKEAQAMQSWVQGQDLISDGDLRDLRRALRKFEALL